MKKAYEKPLMEIAEFRFAEHIAASGTALSCSAIQYQNSVAVAGGTTAFCTSYSVWHM